MGVDLNRERDGGGRGDPAAGHRRTERRRRGEIKKVHVLGPNLLGSNTDETFHVHAEGCADVRRSPVYAGSDHQSDRKTAYDFASLVEVAAFVYDFEDDPQDCIGDFKVFDCAKELPRG
jgi:hypothetical protein